MSVQAISRATETDLAVASLIEERSRFLQFVERRISDRAAAEDLLQAAYARAVAQAGTLRDGEAARAWFYRILRNAAIDFYRHRAFENRVVSAMPDDFDAAEPPRAEDNTCQCIHHAVDQLKTEYAEVLREVELADQDTGSLESYAARTGITTGNASVRAHRARKALMKSLQHTCGSCAGAGCLNCTCAQPLSDHQG